MKIKALLSLLIWAVSGILTAHAADTWSTQDYDFYAGDFNGDGKTDILYVAKAADRTSGILLSDGTSPTISGQSWASNYLGIPWAGNAYSVIVADFNGDGKSDILLQSNTAGDSYVLLTDVSGHISAISQTIADGAMGLEWSSGGHVILAGDFNGDGKADLLLQSTYAGGVNAVVVADANGQFTSTTPLQTWSDGFLGFNWSAQEAVVNVGDFNGDGRADLLVQAYPYYIGDSSPIYAPNMNGVAFGEPGAVPFTLNAMQSWSRGGFGADWSPLSYHLVVADFNGDGRADVLMQPLNAGQNAYLLTGNKAGPVFSTAGAALPTNTNIAFNAARLIAGTFGTGRAAGLYIQATSSTGTNFFASTVAGGIKANTIAITMGSSSSSPPAPAGPTGTAPASALAGAIMAPATLPNTSAGRTAAQFSVSPTGGATYNIPIWTPPGIRNIEPHLALHYTSGGPDGVMGPGWALSGLSAIARCGKTWASTGGAPAGVTLSTSDDMCLDGNRLRVVTGYTAYCSGGTTYMTELADFSLISACGTAGNGPAYFVVQGKDSHYYEYGNTSTSANSRIYANGGPGTPYAWALDKVSDKQGNTLLVTYNAASVVTPAMIQYTANSNAGVTYGYAVSFTYAARTGGTTLTKYVAGYSVTQANQLTDINVTAGGVSVRQYLLNYGSSGTTSRPLIASVQECGGSAGTDCLRPTTINYQSGSAGWSTNATTMAGPTGQYGFIPMDLNGDGIPDAVYGKPSGANTHWYARIATTSGYGAEIDTGATTSSLQLLIPGAFSGTGKTQFVGPVGTTWYVYSFNGTGFTSASTGVTIAGENMALDYDGDGLPDLASASGWGVSVRRNTTTPGGAVAFASTSTTVATFSGGNALQSPQSVPVDFNGDGKGDLVTWTQDCFPGGCIEQSMIVISNGFSSPATVVGNLMFLPVGYTSYLDVNGDGCTDIITPTDLYISNCAGGFSDVTTGLTSVGAMMPTDWDGDGQTDLVYVNSSNNTLYMAHSTGTGFAAPISLGIAAPTTKSFFAVDQNSDGQPDLMYVDSANGYAVGYYPHSGVNTPPDLASSITDGFGINFSPTYVPISQNYYSKNADAVFPDIDYQGPMYAVNQFSASDGTGGTYTNSFWYYGARLNQQGRGFEGFYAARIIDSRNQTYRYIYYRRDFPYIGSLWEDDLYQYSGTSLVSHAWNNFSYTTLNGTTGNQRYFPYIYQSLAYTYEVMGAKTGLSTSYTVTNYGYDAYGNLTSTAATTTDTDAAAGSEPASPFNGQAWTTTITNTITNDTSTNWCLGRPSTTTTTKTAPSQPALTRTVNHTIDNANCRATQEVVEPNDARLKVTTNFGFDAAGNTNSVQVIGLDRNGNAMTARTTTTSYGTRYQMPESVTNPLSQTSLTAYRYDLGVPSSSTDPNGISVSWLYDNFARKTKETRPDNTYTTTTYSDCVSASCWGELDLRFLTQEASYSSGSTLRRQQYNYYDGMDRSRYNYSNRALGTWTANTVTWYDSLGRKTYVYLPSSGTYNGYHGYGYDVRNRVTGDVLYNSSGGIYRGISMTYSGQTITVTDPKGNPITKVTDVAGNLRWVTDPNTNGTVAGTTKYTYDAFNNLITILDAGSNTSTYTYNIRGFKTAAADADTGVWNFVPDSLNELVSQTDAKSQTTTFGYDLLGRMTSRVEPESTTATTWIFGTVAANHEIGRIKTVSKPDGYGESYVYDSIGRPATVTYTEDAVNYPFTYAYNGTGTVDTVTYPVSTSGYSFVLKNLYDAYGFLNQTKDNAAGTVFWTLQSNNDSSLPTGELLGNGTTVTTSYTPWTNEMVTRQEGTSGSTTNLQNLSYSWDLNGNLGQRQDLRQSLTEAFTLDAMNRLKTATLNGTQTLSMAYDATGNITNKSDVSASNYVYGNAAHPHAVTTAGSWTLGYDANGNMTSRAGSTISWYSYNLPNLINYGTSSSQFYYNANHQRWKQVANYAGTVETTHYVGGLLEIMTKGSVTEYRHQIPAGATSTVYTRRSSGTNSTYYATSDHLGSSDLVMDSSANVLARESFTPFGARRGSNWQGVPTTGDYTTFDTTTRRGFTGHEMLDAVSLIHMNGRVYDPYLGRFISGDTVIQNLAATQSVNPYSYVWNDPLKYVDPSGHFSLGDLLGIIFAVAIIFINPFGELLLTDLEYNVLTAALAGFVGGFVGALTSTGSLSAALTAGLIGGITGAAFGAVGSFAQSAADAGSPWSAETQSLAHAAVGCGSVMLSGGNCGRGALAAAVSEEADLSVIKPASAGFWGTTKTAVEEGVVGGTTSSILGGSFQEGFSTSAAGYLFNEYLHQSHGPPGKYSTDQLAGTIYNETASLSGEGISDARIDIGYVAENRVESGIYNGIEDDTISAGDSDAIVNGYKPALSGYLDASSAADYVLQNPGSDPTLGSKQFFMGGQDLPLIRNGAYLVTELGPFTNSFPTSGSMGIPNPAYIGIYHDITPTKISFPRSN